MVTGGANGIGLATVRRLAESGATVAMWDRVVERGEAAVDELRKDDLAVSFFPVDVTDAAAVEAALKATVARSGGVDILINNAGITRDAQLVKVKGDVVEPGMSAADFDAVIEVNLKGVFTCTRAIVPGMIERRWGRIVNAASVVAMNGNFGQTNYVASKAGVIGMTQVWSRELGKRGITVNAVAPGFIATEMTGKMPPATLDTMRSHTPVGRLGTPEDVAAVYCFLVSEYAAFVNGATVTVDGGLVIGT